MENGIEYYEDEGFLASNRRYKRLKAIKTAAIFLSVTAAFSSAVVKSSEKNKQNNYVISSTQESLDDINTIIDDFLIESDLVEEGVYQDGDNFYQINYCPYEFDGENYIFKPQKGYYLFDFYMIKKVSYDEIPDGTAITTIRKVNSIEKVL